MKGVRLGYVFPELSPCGVAMAISTYSLHRVKYLHQVFSLKVVVTDSSLSFIRLRAITLSDVASTLVVSSKLCLYLCFIKLLSNCAADIWHLFSMRP